PGRGGSLEGGAGCRGEGGACPEGSRHPRPAGRSKGTGRSQEAAAGDDGSAEAARRFRHRCISFTRSWPLGGLLGMPQCPTLGSETEPFWPAARHRLRPAPARVDGTLAGEPAAPADVSVVDAEELPGRAERGSSEGPEPLPGYAARPDNCPARHLDDLSQGGR